MSGTSFKSTFYLFEYLSKQRGTPPVLLSLEYLEVRSGPRPAEGIVASGVPFLLELSPRLEVLILRGRDGLQPNCFERYFCADQVQPALESLVEIQMIGWDLTTRNTDSYVLERFLTATKRLRTFKYISSCGDPSSVNDWVLGLFCEEYPPRHWINMLLRVQSTLQHLTLVFGHRGLTQNPLLPNAEGIIIDCRQLKQFTNLETLEIDQFCYCPHQQDPLDRQTEGTNYLADMLPISVRKLTISFPRHDGGHQCLDCILHLGQRAVAAEFPLLEHIEINARDVTPVFLSDRMANPRTLVDDVERDITNHRFRIEEAFMGSRVVIRYRFWVNG